MHGNESQVIRNARFFIVSLLFALLVVPAARADDTYAGIGYGRAVSEDIETDNLAIIVGHSLDKGLGVEFFYAPTIDEDEISAGSLSADITLDTYGILVYYKTSADDFGGYLKVGAGVAVVDLEFDFGSLGSLEDDTSGLAYGIAFGTRVGGGAIEFSYLLLPDIDEFEGIDVDAEVDMLGISYQWYFK